MHTIFSNYVVHAITISKMHYTSCILYDVGRIKLEK